MSLAGINAAYVLRCTGADEARAIARSDPLVVSGAADAVVTGWDLLGISVNAIDADIATT